MTTNLAARGQPRRTHSHPTLFATTGSAYAAVAAAVAKSRLRATPIISHPLSPHARYLARPAHARASVCVLTLSLSKPPSVCAQMPPGGREGGAFRCKLMRGLTARTLPPIPPNGLLGWKDMPRPAHLLTRVLKTVRRHILSAPSRVSRGGAVSACMFCVRVALQTNGSNSRVGHVAIVDKKVSVAYFSSGCVPSKSCTTRLFPPRRSPTVAGSTCGCSRATRGTYGSPPRSRETPGSLSRAAACGWRTSRTTPRTVRLSTRAKWCPSTRRSWGSRCSSRDRPSSGSPCWRHARRVSSPALPAPGPAPDALLPLG